MKYSLFIFAALLLLIPAAVAQEETNTDIMVAGLELEKILSFINGCIALFLGIVSLYAYKTDGRKRLLYVSAAFFIFSLKGFLGSLELFMEEIGWIDPLLIVLELLVLICFFFGVIKK